MDDLIVKPFVEESLALVFNKWLAVNNPKMEDDPADSDDAIDAGVHFDLGVVQDILGDDEQIIDELICLAKIELDQSVKELAAGIANNDIEALNVAGHKLYGSAASSGFIILSKIAREFETMRAFNKKEMDELFIKTTDETALIFKLIDKTFHNGHFVQHLWASVTA
jgi:HPt (histidine-containing phosphotransfer) domain-containing protein